MSSAREMILLCRSAMDEAREICRILSETGMPDDVRLIVTAEINRHDAAVKRLEIYAEEMPR